MVDKAFPNPTALLVDLIRPRGSYQKPTPDHVKERGRVQMRFPHMEPLSQFLDKTARKCRFWSRSTNDERIAAQLHMADELHQKAREYEGRNGPDQGERVAEQKR